MSLLSCLPTPIEMTPLRKHSQMNVSGCAEEIMRGKEILHCLGGRGVHQLAAGCGQGHLGARDGRAHAKAVIFGRAEPQAALCRPLTHIALLQQALGRSSTLCVRTRVVVNLLL